MLRLHGCQTRYGRIIIVSLDCSTLVVWGENPVTVVTLRLLYIDLIRVIATVMESANTGGILFSPVFTVNINCWEVVFTAAFTVTLIGTKSAHIKSEIHFGFWYC